jgi:hypothetical protein
VLTRGACGCTVHLGNWRPAVRSFELTSVTGAQQRCLAKAVCAQRRQSMLQPPAFNALGGRASCARLVFVPVVRDTWRPRTDPLQRAGLDISRGPNGTWRSRTRSRGPGLRLLVLSTPPRDTWRRRTHSLAGSGSVAVFPSVGFGPLGPGAQAFRCGYDQPPMPFSRYSSREYPGRGVLTYIVFTILKYGM